VPAVHTVKIADRHGPISTFGHAVIMSPVNRSVQRRIV
jgi:hypothetical protein